MSITPKGQRFASVHGPCSSGVYTGANTNLSVVLVDGVDVLSRCESSSEPDGFADCFKVNGSGQKYYWMTRDGEAKVARERLFGVVEMRLQGEAP